MGKVTARRERHVVDGPGVGADGASEPVVDGRVCPPVRAVERRHVDTIEDYEILIDGGVARAVAGQDGVAVGLAGACKLGGQVLVAKLRGHAVVGIHQRGGSRHFDGGKLGHLHGCLARHDLVDGGRPGEVYNDDENPEEGEADVEGNQGFVLRVADRERKMVPSVFVS